MGANKGLGMAIAQAVNLQAVTLALQTRLGYQPERIKLTLLSEDGTVRMVIDGSGLGGRISTPPFQKSIVLRPGETLASLVHRAALAGVAEIDPYFTALYLVRSHAADKDFTAAETQINKAKAGLPPTPVSYDRSLLENLQGIIALFQAKPDEADEWFHRSISSDPNNAVAVLNAAFADLQLNDYHRAIEHVQDLVASGPPSDKILLATAYMTWGAALLGLQDVTGADQNLAKAIEINPDSSTAYDLWAEAKHKSGDEAAAARLHQAALEASGTFENYAEVAALYFELAWEHDQPITRNKFTNPPMTRFN